MCHQNETTRENVKPGAYHNQRCTLALNYAILGQYDDSPSENHKKQSERFILFAHSAVVFNWPVVFSGTYRADYSLGIRVLFWHGMVQDQ